MNLTNTPEKSSVLLLCGGLTVWLLYSTSKTDVVYDDTALWTQIMTIT